MQNLGRANKVHYGKCGSGVYSLINGCRKYSCIHKYVHSNWNTLVLSLFFNRYEIRSWDWQFDLRSDPQTALHHFYSVFALPWTLTIFFTSELISDVNDSILTTYNHWRQSDWRQRLYIATSSKYGQRQLVMKNSLGIKANQKLRNFLNEFKLF